MKKFLLLLLLMVAAFGNLYAVSYTIEFETADSKGGTQKKRMPQ